MKTLPQTPSDDSYRESMGRLLVLYTQVDRLIMEICAERIASAPDLAAKLALAKQVGDESRHVMIQHNWMQQFGTDTTPVISDVQEESIRNHFQKLTWLEFLADMYLCVEALGSEAVENIVPLADPGTRESLHVPLSDEQDHVAFGINRLKEELAQLPAGEREAFLEGIPRRIEALTDMFLDFGLEVAELFEKVGASYTMLCDAVRQRQDEVLQQVAA
ncbi:MAG: ferritin-like domain-containing protein [Gammaproteobacteria bacterium]|nr:MAG: ferritin-like domain-containing protein [Gammaproteobacteria bacterium]